MCSVVVCIQNFFPILTISNNLETLLLEKKLKHRLLKNAKLKQYFWFRAGGEGDIRIVWPSWIRIQSGSETLGSQYRQYFRSGRQAKNVPQKSKRWRNFMVEELSGGLEVWRFPHGAWMSFVEAQEEYFQLKKCWNNFVLLEKVLVFYLDSATAWIQCQCIWIRNTGR